VQRNIDEIGKIYANKHQNPEHPIVGPEVDTPRFHAFWVNHPRTLGQATRMSSEVVVATANYVTEGETIRSTDLGGVDIPTQRVTFTVKRSQKGSLRVGDTFVLYQNGNDENRFDEDPSYKTNHRYLLFLVERGDGTYMVISPEGRYQVTRDGLVPAVHNDSKSFAADLAGASLTDILSDVERTVVEFPEQ
jgi:hypothetical protein